MNRKVVSPSFASQQLFTTKAGAAVEYYQTNKISGFYLFVLFPCKTHVGSNLSTAVCSSRTISTFKKNFKYDVIVLNICIQLRTWLRSQYVIRLPQKLPFRFSKLWFQVCGQHNWSPIFASSDLQRSLCNISAGNLGFEWLPFSAGITCIHWNSFPFSYTDANDVIEDSHGIYNALQLMGISTENGLSDRRACARLKCSRIANAMWRTRSYEITM